ncbi:hypothetical protein [Hahella ganghwensis]|uniref:hypothetical protein n=1 Tax=Hahella ganghwensis TaxID=286420 RepID=UPI0003704285|nr:hypothetical protein [Hahella ganghwensis]
MFPFIDKEVLSKALLKLSIVLLAFAAASANSTDNLAQRTESLKKRVIELNRELYKLEEEILYPANTQVVVFLSVAENADFELDSVELSLNGILATSYLYSEREVNALKQGGVQRLYMGSLSAGPHKVEAVFNGRGGNDKYFRNAATLNFEKGSSSKFIELRVERNNSKTNLPRFLVKEMQR